MAAEADAAVRLQAVYAFGVALDLDDNHLLRESRAEEAV